MRMRLKYVIGGALVALTTLAAPGPANAVLITEPAGVESGVLNGVMNVGGLIPLGVLVDTGGLGSGVATPAGSGMNIINAGCNTTGTPLGEPCGDTVVVTAGAVA